MAMNRIQFQPGLSLTGFYERYGTEAQCEQALERARWPNGFACGRCGHSGHCVVWHGRVKTFQCQRCRHQATLTSGTIFQATKLPLRRWFQAMYHLTQTKNNVAALELRRLLGVCYRTAWRIKHKLLQVMVESEADRRLAVRVEIDDAYLGGELAGGKRGRGSENKVPFVAAVQAAGCRHDPNPVGRGRKSTHMPCFTWVNTVLGNLKTAMSGTYHAFGFDKYGYRYLAEAQYRFNRRFDLTEILPATLGAAVAIGPRTERWLRLAEARR